MVPGIWGRDINIRNPICASSSLFHHRGTTIPPSPQKRKSQQPLIHYIFIDYRCLLCYSRGAISESEGMPFCREWGMNKMLGIIFTEVFLDPVPNCKVSAGLVNAVYKWGSQGGQVWLLVSAALSKVDEFFSDITHTKTPSYFSQCWLGALSRFSHMHIHCIADQFTHSFLVYHPYFDIHCCRPDIKNIKNGGIFKN